MLTENKYFEVSTVNSKTGYALQFNYQYKYAKKFI